MAERDVLTKRVQVLREVFNQASSSSERYSRSEIKFVTTVDVRSMGKQLDKLSSELRTLDVEIQSINFATELMWQIQVLKRQGHFKTWGLVISD